MNFLLLFQRYRYAEAYQVNLKLQSLEQDFLSKKLVGEEKSSNMQSQSHWRTELVVSGIPLLLAVIKLFEGLM